jgi:hypothetical protein
MSNFMKIVGVEAEWFHVDGHMKEQTDTIKLKVDCLR